MLFLNDNLIVQLKIVMTNLNDFSLLIIEDDHSTQELLKAFFCSTGASVSTASDGNEALKAFREQRFDIILLDVIIPVLDGFSLLKKIREEGNTTPVIMLTDQQTTYDKVKGFDYGADDYVTKPFNLAELLARVKAQIRHKQQANSEKKTSLIKLKKVIIDPLKREIKCKGELLPFTKTEFDLFAYLTNRRDEAVSHTTILQDVLHYQATDIETKAIAMHVANIRRKLKAAECGFISIKAVSGVGYRLLIED